jgi:hypothetical protein
MISPGRKKSLYLMRIACCLLTIGLAVCRTDAAAGEMAFVLIGQSNMVGFGQVRDLPANQTEFPANIIFYDQGERKQLGQQRRFGPEVGFARTLAEAFPDDTIVLAKYAVGGTSIAQWMPYDSGQESPVEPGPAKRSLRLYPALMDALKPVMAGNSRVCAVLLMQGEADAKNDALAKAYGVRLADFIAALRRDLKNAQFLLLYGKVNPPADRFPAVALLRNQQETLKTRVPGVEMISTDDLSKRPDGLHYDSSGQLELGRRFAAAYLRYAGTEGCEGIRLGSAGPDRKAKPE